MTFLKALYGNPWMRGLGVLATLVVTLLVLWWRGPEWGLVADAFRLVEWTYIFAAIGLNLLSVVARALAWRTVVNEALREHSPPFGRIFSAFGIGLLSSHTDLAQAAERMLKDRYDWAETNSANVLVALGGDGFMLHTLHAMLETGDPRPVFGMNRGTVGFLMNDWRLDNLAERIEGGEGARPELDARADFAQPR